MNFGMIGALGGVGQSFINQADDLRKEEVANADMARKKSLETWLMQARDDFAIKSEGRAVDRAIATENRVVQAGKDAVLYQATPEAQAAALAAGKAKQVVTAELIPGDVKNKADTATQEFEAGASTRAAKEKEDALNKLTRDKADTAAKVGMMNDPAYIKGLRNEALAKHVDTGAGLRAIQTDLAALQLARAKEESKIPSSVNKTLDSYNKQSDILTTAMARSDFDPTTENGKATVAKALQIRSDYAGLMAPYLPAGAVKPPPMQDVFLKGKVIGQASTDEEAKAMGKAYIESTKKKDVNPILPAATVNTPAANAVPATAGSLTRPEFYVGIERVSPSRGKPGGFSYQGKVYSTEQAALAAYYQAK